MHFLFCMLCFFAGETPYTSLVRFCFLQGETPALRMDTWGIRGHVSPKGRVGGTKGPVPSNFFGKFRKDYQKSHKSHFFRQNC